jgi:hypothetical protein
VRPAKTNRPEHVRHAAESNEFVAESAFERHREVRVHRRRCARLARQRREKRLDSAVHVAAGDVKDAHQGVARDW